MSNSLVCFILFISIYKGASRLTTSDKGGGTLPFLPQVIKLL